MDLIFSDDFDVLEDELLRLEISGKLPGGVALLPCYEYDIVLRATGETVGTINVRIGHNFHSYYNGNIGYEIARQFRGHHYAREAVKLVLPVARSHGMDHLILTCEEDNIASRRTIEGTGAELLETVQVPMEYFAWYKGIPRHRIYRLAL